MLGSLLQASLRPSARAAAAAAAAARPRLPLAGGAGWLAEAAAAAGAGRPPRRQLPAAPDLLRCYSNAEASSSAPTAQAVPAPAPRKYNLRPLSKDDVDYTFARSGGAGGQNVNKVNTKVDMRFDLDGAAWVPHEVKDAVRRAEKNRFTKDGVLFITSTRHRTQSQNLDDCLAKLQAMLDAGVEAVTPKEIDPETIKRVKANIKAGNERRLDAKKKDAKKKSERRRRDFD